MAEFKISDGLSDEVSSLLTSGASLGEGSVDIDTAQVDTLSTSLKYVQQQKDIRKVLRAYANLLNKDCNDLTKMISDVKHMDETLSTISK